MSSPTLQRSSPPSYNATALHAPSKGGITPSALGHGKTFALRALCFPGVRVGRLSRRGGDTSLFTCFEQWLCCPDVSLSAPRSELRSERDSVPHPAQGRCPGFFRALSRKKSTLPRANAALGTGVYCPPLRRTTSKPRTLKLFPQVISGTIKAKARKPWLFSFCLNVTPELSTAVRLPQRRSR